MPIVPVLILVVSVLPAIFPLTIMIGGTWPVTFLSLFRFDGRDPHI